MRMRWLVLGVPGLALTAGAQATVRGTVWDSLSGRPLVGAVVQLVRADTPTQRHTAAADSTGRYRIDGVAAGVWAVGFMHPALDELGFELPLLRFELGDAREVQLPLGTPGPETLNRRWCQAGAESGFWVGRVRSATEGGVIPGATVDVQWTTFASNGRTVVEQTPTRQATGDESGRFLLCGLPRTELVMARAHATDTSGVLTFSLPATGVLQRDVFVAPAGERAIGASGDSVLRGPGRVRGRVMARGRPVNGARVRIDEVGAEGVANSEGYFAIERLPLGTWTMDARAIGYMTGAQLVDIVAGEPGDVTFELPGQEQFLDTVKVTGDRLVESAGYREFLERRAVGSGFYVDEAQIERRHPQYIADLVREFPGVFVTSGQMRGNQLDIRFRAYTFGARTCAPDVFVDGTFVPNTAGAGMLESMVSIASVRAVEVYPRVGSVPQRFQRNSGCGALVLWTGERRKVQVPKPPT